jgi:hypothetical protein
MRQPVPRTLSLARELHALAERSGDPAQVAIASGSLGYSLFIAGEQAEADGFLCRVVTLADRLPDAEFGLYGEHPRIICRLYQGVVRCLMGYPDAGARVAEEGLARDRTGNNPHTIAWSLMCAADARLFGRDAGPAEQLAAEAIALAQEHRLPQWLAFAQQVRGWALCQLGAVEEGLTLLEESVRRLHATGAVLHT